MDIYIDLLEQLKGYIRKFSQIGDVHLFKDKGDGIRGVIEPGNIDPGGPVETGKEYNITIRLISSYDYWKQLFQKIGILDDKLNSCFQDEEQTINLRCEVGSWIRVEDEANFIYETTLIVRAVRVVP
jgi:hypothetical protein